MNTLTTKEILEKVSASGDFKATAPAWKLFLLGILAGAYIAFGAYASTVASFNLVSDPATFGLGKLVVRGGTVHRQLPDVHRAVR